MSDPAVLHFREIVVPTVREFLRETSDKRLGCLAALAVASMTEHYFHARPELGTTKADLSRFKELVRTYDRGGNFAIGWIADVANATKHVISNRNRIGFTDINTMTLNQCGVMRAGWPLGGEEVLVGDSPSPSWRLSELASASMVFWCQRLGLSDNEWITSN